jgi:LSD1 subclass zinc finger protein
MRHHELSGAEHRPPGATQVRCRSCAQVADCPTYGRRPSAPPSDTPPVIGVQVDANTLFGDSAGEEGCRSIKSSF